MRFFSHTRINMAKYKNAISTKIEANKDKIYRANDPILFAEIFFPHKNASTRRAALLAIFREIKNSQNQRIESTYYIVEKYGLSQSCVIKARVKMARIGLIVKREGYWKFSTVFANAIRNLVLKCESYQVPAQNCEERDRERLYIEMAKGFK